MKAIIGLGNHGGEYAKTRHNVGFAVVLRLIAKNPNRWSKPQVKQFGRFFSRQSAMVARTNDGETIAMLPQMYMNNSGGCIQAVTRSNDVKLPDALMICDEVQLPAGRMRFSASGSSGGHNGLESVIHSLGSDGFPRLRVGIGPKPASEKLKDYVLGEFNSAEKPIIEETVNRAADA